MKRKIQAGTTSLRLRIFVQDSSSTVGAGLTGLAYNTASLTWYYIRDADSATVAVTLATATLGTWATGGFIVVDATHMPGVYEISVPNAAITGSDCVHMMLQGAANMVPVLIEIELDAVNYQSATAFVTGINSIAPPANWNLMSVDGSGRVLLQPTQTGVTIPTVTTVGTLTTYTGNTPQTGDAFARIGSTGSGLSSLAPASTALSTANYTTARAGYLDNLNVGGAVASHADATTIETAVGTPMQAGSTVALSSSGLDLVMIEAGLNARQSLSIIAAAVAGVGGTSTNIYAGAGVATTRITFAATAGQRSSVTLSPPA